MKTEIINFKETLAVKTAIRIAAAKAGFADSSKMLSDIVRKNPLIAKEIKNISKKVA